MIRRVPLVLALAGAGLLAVPSVQAAPPIGEFAAAFDRRPGFFTQYWDAETGRLLLEIPSPGEDFLYMVSLASGLGDTQVMSLDKGRPGRHGVARFERVGPRVHLVLINSRFRAESASPALARSVADSFPTTTVAALEVVAEDLGRVLVDATPLFLDDVMDVAGALREAERGSYKLDRQRSRIFLERTRAFPENTEVEAALTFTSAKPGRELYGRAPDPRALTLRQHHSFVKLPDDGFRPRRFDPRIGVFPVTFYDYARGFDEGYVQRYIRRHRLVKKTSGAVLSEPVEPIVYYLDPAVPEPYRSAFKEGALWWNRVFEDAGFKNAFQVADMPPDMDPLDARYHVIQWFHRTEGGSSVGPSFVDPRTGEIIKAAVRMDSHRSLANYELYAALRPALLDAGPRPAGEAEAFVMARRRQHAAHEVGHTLGLAHNFAAAFDGRASVMAYPAPLVRLQDGRLDVSEAYHPGPGAYDSLVIRYAYTQFAPEEEEAGLQNVLAELQASGLKFITNPDQGASSSFPSGSTWVNGREPVEELARVMAVRRFVLERFDERALNASEPLATLRRRLWAAYAYHVPTLTAAVKAVGGMRFRYAVLGDTLPPTQIVGAARQRRALELVLDAIQPGELAIPERILRLLAPRPFGYGNDRHAPASAAAPAFDQVDAARSLAGSVLGALLAPERAARVVAFAHRDSSQLTLEALVDRVIARTWRTAPAGKHAALRRAVERAVVDELIRLAAYRRATPDVRAAAEWGLAQIAAGVRDAAAGTPSESAHRRLVRADIERFLTRHEVPKTLDPVQRPPRRLPLDEATTCGGQE